MTVTESEIRDGDISDAVRQVQNSVVVEASTAYDLLTDLTQLKDIPRTITQISGDIMKIMSSLRAKHGLSVFRDAAKMRPRQLLRSVNKAFRAIGSEWMNYRYGIMPLVYSVVDLTKALNRGQDVTSRKSLAVAPHVTGQLLPPSNYRYTIKRVTGSVTIRGLVFQHFASDEIARLSSIGLNPVTTAWELIPYSFVVDWFVNVGDTINAATSSTWAQQKWACLSRRDNLVKTTHVHLLDRSETIQVGNILPTQGWVGTPPAQRPPIVISNPAGDYILEKETIDSYSRWVIPVTYAPPIFNPSLNWKRYFDGAVLGVNQLRRLGRLFR